MLQNCLILYPYPKRPFVRPSVIAHFCNRLGPRQLPAGNSCQQTKVASWSELCLGRKKNPVLCGANVKKTGVWLRKWGFGNQKWRFRHRPRSTSSQLGEHSSSGTTGSPAWLGLQKRVVTATPSLAAGKSEFEPPGLAAGEFEFLTPGSPQAVKDTNTE